MDIPNDLNKLLEQLKQVTRDTNRMSRDRCILWLPAHS